MHETRVKLKYELQRIFSFRRRNADGFVVYIDSDFVSEKNSGREIVRTYGKLRSNTTRNDKEPIQCTRVTPES